MIVAMVLVRMMQPPVHKVIDMVTVRDSFVSATQAMHVLAMSIWSATHRVLRGDRYNVFVHMIAIHMLQMSVLKIVNVPVVQNRSMPAVWAMYMSLGHVFTPYPFPLLFPLRLLTRSSFRTAHNS
jgi:hypothetical protein